MEVIWDDGSTGEYTGEAQATPQTVTWDDGTTSDYEAPTDEVLTDIPAVGSGVTDPTTGVYSTIEEEGGQTASPQDIQLEKDRMTTQAMGKDIEEVRTATSSAWDNIKQTFSDDKAINKAIEKRDSKTSKMLLDKYGARVEKRGEDKVLVFTNDDGTTRAIDYPEEGNLLDVIASARREGEYGVAGAAIGAGIGSLAGPIGTGVGAVVGGGIGATVGALSDVERSAERQDIEVTTEEKTRLARHAGITDMVAGVVLGGLTKVIQPRALADFTTLADMPKRYRKDIKNLQEKSGLNDEQMEKAIQGYASTTERGAISELKAVEAGTKVSEKEQVGFATEAMKQDTTSKKMALEESTTRSNIIGDELKEDAEFYSLYKRRTLDDEGRRKATNWKGLKQDLEGAGFEKGDAVYDMVAENAKVFGTKETDIFQQTVKAVSPDSMAADFIAPFTSTARGGPKAQAWGTGFKIIDDVLHAVFPGADRKTVNTVKKAMKEGVEPKKLSDNLVDSGMERVKAERLANEVAKAEVAATKEAEVSAGKKATEFEKVIKKEEKAGSAIEAGIDKDVTEFKKTKTTMQKQKKAEETKKAKEEVKDLKDMKESMRRAGVDWDEANLDKSVSAKDKARLKEARRRAQVDATSELGDTDSDVAVVKLQQEILEKKGKGTFAMGAGIRRKSTPNQEAAAKAKELNPDDKEAVTKALFAKSPEVQAKKTAEKGLAEEVMEQDNYTSAKKSISPKKVNTLADMDDLKEITRNPNSTEKERINALQRRRAVASREAFGSDDLAVDYKTKKGNDENYGFGKHIVKYKDELNLDYKKIKRYYEVQGTNIPPAVKKAYEPETMKVGIKKPNLKEKHFKDIEIKTKVGVAKSWERNKTITDKMVVEYYKEMGKDVPQSIINSSRRLWKGE